MGVALKGKIALVTAASQGLGLACAKSLAEAGCAVAICGRRQEIVESARLDLEASSEQPVVGEIADLTRAADLERLVSTVQERLGGLDILVVNSGHIPYGGLEDFEDEQWYQAFDLLLMSAVRLSRLAIPEMRRRGGGDIVFIGSSTVRNPPPHLLLSTVMRVGISGLAKTMARSLAGENIRVNVVLPGLFDTGRVAQRIDDLMIERGLSREEVVIAEFAGEVPMERIGAAEELAALLTFIVSRQAAYMTGTVITLDGGADRSIL
jgi:3-oxoacyl-[acyl-carrier protein] reductase